jgi:hypothetical protein
MLVISTYSLEQDSAMNDKINRIQDALSHHPRLARYTHYIGVERDGETIVLTGKLPSYFLKQVFQEMVRREIATDVLENRVSVGFRQVRPHADDTVS